MAGIMAMKWDIGNKKKADSNNPELDAVYFEALEKLDQTREVLKKAEKERLALNKLLEVNGNVESMNNVCDEIKQMRLVEGYE